MSETMFPQRQRCKACRKSLMKMATHLPVFKGLYCSPKCAGMAEPIRDVGKAPRECRTQRSGSWVFKRRYRSEDEIPDVIRQDPSTNWYWCGNCGHLHIGHTRMGEAEQFRILGSEHDLADVLVKLRGKATRTQVAKAAGVQPIRLKELELPKRGQRVDLPTLFKVLAVLQARPGVALTQMAGSRGRESS